MLILYVSLLNVTYTVAFVSLFDNAPISIDLIFLNIFCHFLIVEILLRYGDIESNPGPKDRQSLSICYYNINSLSAHNFEKLSSLEAFNSVHDFDVICISESFLDSSFSFDDSSLELRGFKLVRADRSPIRHKKRRCVNLPQRKFTNQIFKCL